MPAVRPVSRIQQARRANFHARRISRSFGQLYSLAARPTVPSDNSAIAVNRLSDRNAQCPENHHRARPPIQATMTPLSTNPTLNGSVNLTGITNAAAINQIVPGQAPTTASVTTAAPIALSHTMRRSLTEPSQYFVKYTPLCGSGSATCAMITEMLSRPPLSFESWINCLATVSRLALKVLIVN